MNDGTKNKLAQLKITYEQTPSATFNSLFDYLIVRALALMDFDLSTQIPLLVHFCYLNDIRIIES